MMIYFFCRVVLMMALLLLEQATSIAAAHRKRKHCPDRYCGDVIIKYPFGIGPKCSKDDNFTISCNTSSSSKPKPILIKLNLELLETPIRYGPWGGDQGSVVVKNTLSNPDYPIAKACFDNSNYSSSEVRWSSPDLRGSPFTYSPDYNTFVSVGCDGIASFYNEAGEKTGGCSSGCDLAAADEGGCNGYKCCQSGLRVDMKSYSIGVRAVKGSCRYAFMTSIDFLNNVANNFTVAAAAVPSSVFVVPVVLYWDYPYFDSQVEMLIVLIFLPILGAILLSCCCFWSCWRYKTKERRKEARLRAKYFKGRLEQSSSYYKTKLFTINELKKATANFSGDRVLGQGGQGTVYKGMLTDGQIVAVKKSNSFEDNQWKQFINEVILLSQVNHKHVVKLLGCCLDTKAPLVVYEFISNGTLWQYIHNTSNEFSLTWEMRIRIASEAADAIAHLHSSSSPPIYHRDIKLTNILLDDKFQAKVSDFGISKAFSADQTHLTTCVQGTFGYLDPEYFLSSQFSEKSDVYSFGVILVELLTGQQAIRVTITEEERSLVLYFITSMHEDNLDEILDPIISQGTEKEEIMVVANLAMQCLKSRGIQRPTMKEVAMELETLRKNSSSSPSFALSSLEIKNAPSISTLVMGNTSNTNPIMYKFDNKFSYKNCGDHDERPLVGATW